MKNATPFQLLAVLLAATLLSVTHCHHDPCGPAVQGWWLPDNTCNRPLDLVTAPAVYGAFLQNDGTGQDLTWYNCAANVFDACTALNDSVTPLGVWNWTSPGSQCVMGFWLPAGDGAAPRMSYESCVDNVFTPMYNLGLSYGGKAYNQVTVNLRTLPDEMTNGSQVDSGYPSYTITYLPLIRGAEIPLS